MFHVHMTSKCGHEMFHVHINLFERGHVTFHVHSNLKGESGDEASCSENADNVQTFSSADIFGFSAASKNRTGQIKAVQGHQDCKQADWQTCPRPPGTLRSKSNQTPGGQSIHPHSEHRFPAPSSKLCQI